MAGRCSQNAGGEVERFGCVGPGVRQGKNNVALSAASDILATFLKVIIGTFNFTVPNDTFGKRSLQAHRTEARYGKKYLGIVPCGTNIFMCDTNVLMYRRRRLHHRLWTRQFGHERCGSGRPQSQLAPGLRP